MRNHKSLKPDDLIKRGPAKIALMVASEFIRASTGSEFRSDVVRCYDRGRELMGVLETVLLSEEAGVYLKPFYQECIERDLLKDEKLDPVFVKNFGMRIAGAFEKAALMLTAKGSHA
jgi:hypothetical protein